MPARQPCSTCDDDTVRGCPADCLMMGDQDDAIQTLLSQLEQLGVSEHIMDQAYHVASITSMVNEAVMDLWSTTHAVTEEPTLREVMVQFTDQFNTRMDAMEARQVQQSSPRSTHSRQQTNSSSRGQVEKLSQQTSTSHKVYCEFCFDKTGKQFSHALTDCLRKKKFSNKVRSKN
jgi:hypothetical protein